MNGCDLDSARLKMRADRAAGTEKSAVRLSTCAGTCRPQSRFSPICILGHFRPPIGCGILRWKKMTFPLEKSGIVLSFMRESGGNTTALLSAIQKADRHLPIGPIHVYSERGGGGARLNILHILHIIHILHIMY